MTNTISERILSLMREKGMRQKDLADLTNLTESAISRYLNGSRIPRGAILLGIANALGTTTDYLTGISDIPRPENTASDLDVAFGIIARNASNMTPEDKDRLFRIIYGGK